MLDFCNFLKDRIEQHMQIVFKRQRIVDKLNKEFSIKIKEAKENHLIELEYKNKEYDNILHLIKENNVKLKTHIESSTIEMTELKSKRLKLEKQQRKHLLVQKNFEKIEITEEDKKVFYKKKLKLNALKRFNMLWIEDNPPTIAGKKKIRGFTINTHTDSLNPFECDKSESSNIDLIKLSNNMDVWKELFK